MTDKSDEFVSESEAIQVASQVFMDIASGGERSNIQIAALLTHLIAGLGNIAVLHGMGLDDWKAKVADTVKNRSSVKLMKIAGDA